MIAFPPPKQRSPMLWVCIAALALGVGCQATAPAVDPQLDPTRAEASPATPEPLRGETPRADATHGDLQPSDSDPFTLHVHLSARGHTVQTTPDTPNLYAKGCPKDGPHICLRGGAYDWQGLYLALVAIKARHPSETVLNLSADPDITFERVVETMDVARGLRVAQGGAPIRARDDAAWASSTPKPCPDGTLNCAPLFPDVVLQVVQ